MIQLIKKHFLYFTVLCFLFVDGCSCSEDPKPDPCAGKIATTAEFTLYERPERRVQYKRIMLKLNKDTVVFSNGFGCRASLDTVYVGIASESISMIFEAKDTSAISYLWTVGENIKNFTVSGFKLEFNSDDTPAFIDIKLIVSKLPNILCFPTDDGKDISVRRIYFRRLGAYEPHPMEGTYKGYLNGDTKDTITIDIKSREKYSEFEGQTFIKNYVTVDQAQRYCGLSITNIGRIKTTVPEYKTAMNKRLSITCYNNGFIQEYTDYGYGVFNTLNSELNWIVAYYTLENNAETKMREKKYYYTTFTGFKIK